MAPESDDPMRVYFRPLGEDEVAKVNWIKSRGNELWASLDGFPPSREMSLAKTNLEQAVMWAVKSITG